MYRKDMVIIKILINYLSNWLDNQLVQPTNIQLEVLVSLGIPLILPVGSMTHTNF